MGPRPKDKVKLRMKSTKKQKRKKTSISDNTVYDTCDGGEANAKNQTLLKTLGDDKATREHNGKIEIKEEGKRSIKNEKSVATDKLKGKSVRVKAVRNISPQKAATTDEKEPFRRPSSAVEQGSEQSSLNMNNKRENQDPKRSHESPKTYRKNSPKHGGQRKIRNKSKSPSRDVNPPDRKAETALHREARNNSLESERNNSPKQREQRNNRNESPSRHSHDGIERSRSPVNFDSGQNDSHVKSKKASKVIRKRSPGSIAIKKHRSSSITRKVASLNNDNQQTPSEEKGSSTRGRSPIPRHDRDTEQKSIGKKPAEASAKLDRSPPHYHKEINNEGKKDSIQRAECKEVRGKSLNLRLKTSHFRKDASKTIKKSKIDGGPKSFPGFRSSGMKVLSGKYNKKATEAEAKTKGKKGKLPRKIRKKLLKSTARKKS